MGWIKELDDLMSKSKSIKYLIITALILIIVAFGSFSYVFIRAANQGQGVDISTGQISPKTIEKQKDQDSVRNDMSNSERVKKIEQPAIIKNYPVTKKPVPKKNTSVENETKNLGNNNHSINGNDNTVGVNGDVNINAEKQLT